LKSSVLGTSNFVRHILEERFYFFEEIHQFLESGEMVGLATEKPCLVG
jgi:hypothetical protein